MTRLLDLLDRLSLPTADAGATLGPCGWDHDDGFRHRHGVESAYFGFGQVVVDDAVADLRAALPDLALVELRAGPADDEEPVPDQLLLRSGAVEAGLRGFQRHDDQVLTAHLELRCPPSALPGLRALIAALDARTLREGWPPGPRIHLVVAEAHQTYLVSQRVQDVGELDLDLHYGPGMAAWHERTLAQLRATHAGLVLLHGPPGTGKTSYVRRLARELTHAKRLVFVPRGLLARMGGPEFTAFLVRELPRRETVLVLEDAEAVLARRVGSDEEASALTSLLLNLTDGLLNDVCRCQVVATFNVPLDDVDPALRRAGRMLGVRRFDPLPAEAARRLARAVGRDPDAITGPTSLAEVFALGEDVPPVPEATPIGFRPPGTPAR